MPDIKNASWLIGTWQGKTNEGLVFYETWNKVNDTLYRNINYHMENSDTIVGGKSEIVLIKNELFYSNGEQGNQNIKWKASLFEKNQMIFENESVLQAKKILFELGKNGRWNATIYSVQDTVNYALQKIK